MSEIYEKLSGGNSVPVTILAMSVMLLAGFLMTRITKRLRLPNVTAYIVAGILIGPYFLDLIPDSFVENTAFLPDIALAFIAFGTGEFFRVEAVRKNISRVIIITLFEAMLATVFVYLLCRYVFALPFSFSVVLSALAAATAPASTMMTIRQLKAKGEFVDTLLQVVALDDIVGLIAYSMAISLAKAIDENNAGNIIDSLTPFLQNLIVLSLGAAFGLILYLFMKTRHTSDNRLIIAIAMLFSFCTIASLIGISPLLGCMAMGSVYINMSGDEGLFKQLNYFSPPILLMFFVRSGTSFDLNALFKDNSFGSTPLILIGVGYFFVRIMGKYLGAFLGGIFTGSEKGITRYLGLALIPQAGVAIGLAELGSRALTGETGNALLTVILASSVLYELIGPAAAKYALYRSDSYDPQNSENTTDQNRDHGALMPGSNRTENIHGDDGSENPEEEYFDRGALDYYEGQSRTDDRKRKKSKKKKQDKNKKETKKKEAAKKVFNKRASEKKGKKK